MLPEASHLQSGNAIPPAKEKVLVKIKIMDLNHVQQCQAQSKSCRDVSC